VRGEGEQTSLEIQRGLWQLSSGRIADAASSSRGDTSEKEGLLRADALPAEVSLDVHRLRPLELRGRALFFVGFKTGEVSGDGGLIVWRYFSRHQKRSSV
jgi:hypothetical protein